MFVLLACVLQPDVDVAKVAREQWFYSTSQGPHRILAEWHTVWILACCVVGGAAQFLAWRATPGAWYYPVAMAVFFVSVATHWAWIAAYFRLVNKFRTGRFCIGIALCVDAFLAGLYVPLNKVSAALLFGRVLAHDIPMLVIAHSAAKIHADPDAVLSRDIRPDRSYVRREAGQEKGDDANLVDGRRSPAARRRESPRKRAPTLTAKDVGNMLV